MTGLEIIISTTHFSCDGQPAIFLYSWGTLLISRSWSPICRKPGMKWASQRPKCRESGGLSRGPKAMMAISDVMLITERIDHQRCLKSSMRCRPRTRRQEILCFPYMESRARAPSRKICLNPQVPYKAARNRPSTARKITYSVSRYGAGIPSSLALRTG